MSAKTGIEWTDATWNPVRGCSRVSPGCTNCYAERVAARFSGGPIVDGGQVVIREAGPFAGFATQSPPRWTGKVALVEDHLLDPLRWRKPRRIFVNSMSDLFHESLSDEAILLIFGVMMHTPRHTFQILTKRAERMRAFMASLGEGWDAYRKPHLAFANYDKRNGLGNTAAALLPERIRWPLPNVWLGVSCEDQARADERIPLLLETPAAVRFVSAEPLLGPLDFVRWMNCTYAGPNGFQPVTSEGQHHRHLRWVIVGGESGPGARPCDLSWIRSIVQQCRAADVACFVKQLGARCGYPSGPGNLPAVSGLMDRFPVPDAEALEDRGDGWHTWRLHDRKGGDPADWPEDLRVREFPGRCP